MKEPVHIKYLVTNEKDVLWGLTIHTVGHQEIEPGMPYPPVNHPSRYLFSPHRGRVLDEYQLVYISRGKGTFVSAGHAPTEVVAGNMFLLFPGEWHNYRPDPDTGWAEYWIGFKGINIDNRIDNEFFSPRAPIFNVGMRQEVVGHYQQAIRVATEQRFGYQPMLAGIVNYLLGCVYSYHKISSLDDEQTTKQINAAKVFILENMEGEIDFEQLASRLHMSYSWFRRTFKKYTGFSPSAYATELKIQKIKELLTHTALRRNEIAFRMGFDNPDYFCSLFKKKTGMSPLEYRRFTQGHSFEPPTDEGDEPEEET